MNTPTPSAHSGEQGKPSDDVVLRFSRDGFDAIHKHLHNWPWQSGKAWDAAVRELERKHEQSEPVPGSLHEFYGVKTDAELIAEQARHIEKLQEKLSPTTQPAHTRVRMG